MSRNVCMRQQDLAHRRMCKKTSIRVCTTDEPTDQEESTSLISALTRCSADAAATMSAHSRVMYDLLCTPSELHVRLVDADLHPRCCTSSPAEPTQKPTLKKSGSRTGPSATEQTEAELVLLRQALEGSSTTSRARAESGDVSSDPSLQEWPVARDAKPPQLGQDHSVEVW